MKFRILLFIPCLYLIFQQLQAQDIPKRGPDLPKVIAASPNAAALGKYGNTPVNLYNGIPEISLPLYEISLNGYSLPISLSYHAEGFRVEEMASWAGLGWTLNAGGVITRTIRGIADEWPSTYGNYKATQDYLNNPNIPQNEKIVCLHEAANGKTDTEPDIYFFNFAGYSGKFFLDENGVAYNIIPQQRIKIQFISASQKWQLTTSDGNSFIFGGSNESVEYNTNYNCSHSGNGFLDCGAITQRMPNSWYLKEISTTTKRKITFSYENYNYSFKTLVGENDYYPHFVPGQPCAQRNLFSYTRNQIEGCRLKGITFDNGKIEFLTPATTRADVAGEKRLSAMKVYNFKNRAFSLLKQIDFFHDYFRYYNKIPSEGSMHEETNAFFRLKLDSVKISNASATPTFYRFKYNETVNLPNRLDPVYGAYSQDHWGFFNNELNNTPGTSGKQYSLVPMFIEKYTDPGTGQTTIRTYEGANRSVTPAYAKANILTAIQYPTAGETAFEYESNTIPVADAPTDVLFREVRGQKGISLSYIPGEANEHIDSFTVNSLENGGVYAETFYQTEHAELPCLETDIVADREIINAKTGESLYYNPTAPVIFIPNGKYIIKMRQKDGYNCVSTSTFMLSWYEKQKIDVDPNNPNIAVGGLRVKKITDYDGLDHNRDIIRNYYYKHFDSTRNVSSGAVVSYPNYIWNGYKERQKNVNVPGYYECEFEIHYSSSNYPLLKTNGGLVGYKNVAVETTKDRIEYTYQTAKDYPDVGDFTNFPFPPPTSMEWKRGLLRKEVQYLKSGATLKRAKERTLDYSYSLTSSLNKQALGLKVGIGLVNSDEIVNETSSPKYEFTPRSYDVLTEWYGLVREEETLYDQLNSSSWVKIRKDYAYDSSSLKPAKITITDSRGGVFHTTYKYPGNYSISASTTEPIAKGIKRLQDLHMLSVPVEQYEQRSNADGSGVRTTGAQLTAYRTDQPLPSSIYIWENKGALTFKPATSGSSGITKDPNYQLRLNFLKYDSFGNILEQKKSNDVLETYIWGYNRAYPVAKILGATHADAAAYASDSILQRPASETQMLAELKKIRVGVAAKALISTYSYTPLVGTTSETDPSGKTTYYEYDNLGRLKSIKDRNKRILKLYDYQYQASTGQAWQPTGKTRCQTGTGGYATGIIEKEEKDVNPESNTYGTLRWINGGQSASCPVSADWQATGSTRCQTGTGGYLTGKGEREERDKNPYSTTYNTVRWIETGINASCAVVADWKATGNSRCVTGTGGYLTGRQEVEQRDMNPYSATYNNTRWLDNGVSTSCPVNPDWQPTGNKRCVVDAWNSNTGDEEAEQKDANPYSATFNTIRWVNLGRTGTCPLPPDCLPKPEYRAVNNVCESGTRIGLVESEELQPNKWRCTYWVSYSYGPYEKITVFSSRPCSVPPPPAKSASH